MAQEARSPWSRWDAPGVQYIPNKNPYSGISTGNPGIGKGDVHYDIPDKYSHQLVVVDSESTVQQTQTLIGTLIGKEYNPFDSAFYNCIYGIPNNRDLQQQQRQTIVQCHVDIDCCETTCCDSNWQTKYGWAIALLSLFCIIIIISLLIWLAFWLINRSKDKRQKRRLLESAQGMSSPTLQNNIGSYDASKGYRNIAPTPIFSTFDRKTY